MRELQRPITKVDSELMPPPPLPFEWSSSGSPGSSSSSSSGIDFSRILSNTATDRASAAADLESVFNIILDMVHLYPHWGKW